MPWRADGTSDKVSDDLIARHVDIESDSTREIVSILEVSFREIITYGDANYDAELILRGLFIPVEFLALDHKPSDKPELILYKRTGRTKFVLDSTGTFTTTDLNLLIMKRWLEPTLYSKILRKWKGTSISQWVRTVDRDQAGHSDVASWDKCKPGKCGETNDMANVRDYEGAPPHYVSPRKPTEAEMRLMSAILLDYEINGGGNTYDVDDAWSLIKTWSSDPTANSSRVYKFVDALGDGDERIEDLLSVIRGERIDPVREAAYLGIIADYQKV